MRLGDGALGDEIDRAHEAIATCAGVPPVGFRAPGYEISSRVIAMLGARAYRYDSSLLPSPAYFAAKALVMARMRLRDRRSASILGNPLAPLRVTAAASLRRQAGGLLELPMAVTPLARVPIIGTSLVLAPEWVRRRLVAGALRASLFNLELHGIDLADAEADEMPPELVARQPDLRRPLAAKLAALDATLAEARASGARFATLAEVAAASPALSPPRPGG